MWWFYQPTKPLINQCNGHVQGAYGEGGVRSGRELGDNAKTTICCTRYGNVMASRGSVIPLWISKWNKVCPLLSQTPT